MSLTNAAEWGPRTTRRAARYGFRARVAIVLGSAFGAWALIILAGWGLFALVA